MANAKAGIFDVTLRIGGELEPPPRWRLALVGLVARLLRVPIEIITTHARP